MTTKPQKDIRIESYCGVRQSNFVRQVPHSIDQGAKWLKCSLSIENTNQALLLR